MTTDAVPVIKCDGCGLVVPARFNPKADGSGGVSEAQRESDLRGEGWTLTRERDMCPRCNERARSASRGRPTLVEAIRQYDAKVFEHAGTINVTPTVHDVDVRSDGPVVQGTARCGARGLVGQPDLHALVCLRCWPWWTA